MGGKNAIIVDDDADLDEAVLGVVDSAFGYAGPEVLGLLAGRSCWTPIYDAFLRPAGRGDAEPDGRPGRGPRLLRSARSSTPTRGERILDYDREGQAGSPAGLRRRRRAARGRGLLRRPAHLRRRRRRRRRSPRRRSSARSWPCSRPRDLDEALEIANGTQYALTGGLYSRSPANIERVKRRVPRRQPVHQPQDHRRPGRPPAVRRLQAVGIGSKAGGPDYLFQFLLPRMITENTMRRGFAPGPRGPCG